MLPLHQAYEVREAVLEYVRATFRFREADVREAFDRFIEDDQNGLFRGPFVSLKTPFIKADADEVIPLDIRPAFTPHRHQIEAFRRLTTQDGHKPQPTLLTTGTGSGKTECFLFPVLDYVYQMNRDGRRQGVKVIIMYPMNALAGDQAKRLAETIWNDPRLKGLVTAGLFIGMGDNPRDYPTNMGEHNIIENRETILGEPPDIVLTNFKMLDYALMQQHYMSLWKGNIGTDRPVLRFMVLDELHTYDGAQGTDVANLIRRLKLKLGIPDSWLTPCGTSATIGNGEDSKARLCEYASDVFGEAFGSDSIIEEHRVTVDDFFNEELDDFLPTETALETLRLSSAKDTEDYLLNVKRAWMAGEADSAVSIGKRLKGLQIAKDLLSVTDKGIVTLPALMSELGKRNAPLRNHPDQAKCVVESLLALISEAKGEDGRTPLLYLQIQLWQRELSGIQRYVQSKPEFTWRDSIVRDGRISLPVWFCRDCGASGWLTTFKKTEHKFGTDTAMITKAFMEEGSRDVRLMSIDSPEHEPLIDYLGDLSVNETYYIHPEDLTIGSQSDENALKVRVLSRSVQEKHSDKIKLDKRCPLCMAQQLAIVGGRTSTLSSVAVSQIMSSDFDSQVASKRKMLTFSNSVQDAAHLAGFYEVRTFRFLFRQSIQQYLKTLDHPVSLAELQRGFKTYWKDRLEGDEYFYRFIPDEWVEKIDLQRNYRDQSGKLSERFKREFDLRVDWEICSEFGLRAQVGRTLEKMGASATFFREEDLRKAFAEMEPWMRENNMGYVADHEPLFLRFTNGLLHRLRLRGGIDHEFLRLYRAQQLRPSMLHWPGQWRREHFLYKKFGGNRIPRLMGPKSAPRDDVLDVTSVRGRENWFHRYFVKAIHIPSGEVMLPNTDTINDFYRKLLDTLAESGILDRQMTAANGVVNYAIRPEALYVEAAARYIKCDACESMMCVAGRDTLTEGTQCLDFKCNRGAYRTVLPNAENYYRRVYNREISPRIYAHEHTGLLERKKREDLEREFKEHPTPHACNVLTATSTLEMGIDIGDLNVVACAGIPPKPSNFLQRVGRAGRKEGSALILNYSKSSKHDMFYFAEPLQMMQGEVSTPGCFLEAKDILRRHFYAFCIDSWTSADESNEIPPTIVSLGHLGHGLTTEPAFFANRIGEFIKEHQVSLMERFRRQYPEKTAHVLDELGQMVSRGVLQKRVLDEFDALFNQLERIRAERAELSQRLESIPQNDTLLRDDIINQGRGLKARYKAIKGENVVEFMTNAGLLPNYAFPETGVKLSATIFSKRAPGDETGIPPELETLELVRPASQGIRELAPRNDFYTEKKKLEIKGLSLTDRSDSVKLMRYCSECDALADEGSEDFSAADCPKCGSKSWRGNLHKYLKFTTATTSVERSEAALDDSADEREQKPYHTMKHFRFRHSGPVTSYGLRKVAFGIEYCKDVVLTEANYGSHEQMAEPVEINKEQHISGLGFVTCKHCGRSKAVVFGNEKPEEFHYPYCKHKDVAFPPDEAHKDTFERLYLYREMQTEAIKVLLPVQLFETGATVALFQAGIELGMRHYYKSSPDHIRIEAYSEYNLATQKFDNYLVVYDTIPGGTGYLSKLYDTKEFTELIRISYEHIRDCQCQHEGKDGCYQCILSYSNQWHRENLSRERAEQLFKNIYDECSSWETVNGGIGTITSSGVIEDSELEILFVKTMERIARENGWSWDKRMDAINETYSYDLTIADDELEAKYAVYPQYRLGPSLGVSKETKPDFQFICVYAKVGEEEIDPQSVPQWSVYLDGYDYHASEGHVGFYNDFRRREAIRLSDREPRLSWTLTWADIQPYIDTEGEGSGFIDPLYVSSPSRELLYDFPNEIRHRKNSVSRFVFMLTHPRLEDLRAEVFAFLASCYTDAGQQVASYESIENALASGEPTDVSDEDWDNEHFFVKTSFLGRSTLTDGSAWYPYDQEADYADSVRYDWHLTEGLTEIGKDDWTDFWRRYDLLQLFSNKPLTASGHAGAIDADEVMLFFPGLEDIVGQLISSGIPFNLDGGFELKDGDGVIIAEAAIKLDGKDVVIDDFSGRPGDAEAFRQKGFEVIAAQDFNINSITGL